MSRKASYFLLLMIALVGVSVMLALWFFKPEAKRRPETKPAPISVELMRVRHQDYRPPVLTQGLVQAKRRVVISAEITGRIMKVSDHFHNGGRVKANKPVLSIDDREYRLALTRTESLIARAESALALEQGQARQAKKLWKDLGSDEANRLFLREYQLDAARAELATAEAEREAARLNLERTQVRVPFDAVIEESHVDVGQFVTPGTPLLTVLDTATAEVRLSLSASQMHSLDIQAGDMAVDFANVDILLQTNRGNQSHQWSARLSRVESSIDTQTGLYTVVAQVDEPMNRQKHTDPLVPGLFVEARLEGPVVLDAISLPKKALMGERVFVYHDQGLRYEPVNVIAYEGDRVWVQSSMAAGERVVISNPLLLREGQRVLPDNTLPNQIPPNDAPSQH